METLIKNYLSANLSAKISKKVLKNPDIPPGEVWKFMHMEKYFKCNA